MPASNANWAACQVRLALRGPALHVVDPDWSKEQQDIEYPAGGNARPMQAGPFRERSSPEIGSAVEDETLVGMMMSEMLRELGFDVLGPIGSVADAIAVVGSEAFDAAILDVNLQGEMVYPVAEAVAARRVPFVFVTGYGSEGIDARFSETPVLQKPIERQMLEAVFAPFSKSSTLYRSGARGWNGASAMHQSELPRPHSG